MIHPETLTAAIHRAAVLTEPATVPDSLAQLLVAETVLEATPGPAGKRVDKCRTTSVRNRKQRMQ